MLKLAKFVVPACLPPEKIVGMIEKRIETKKKRVQKRVDFFMKPMGTFSQTEYGYTVPTEKPSVCVIFRIPLPHHLHLEAARIQWA